MSTPSSELPRGDLKGFVRYLPNDLVSGFLVFLIALPLCLGIAIASGYPPIAGVFTAIVGGIVTTLLSNSELTIKGPAAGLIVIVLGCVTDFQELVGTGPEAAAQAYRMALAVGLAAGVIQILFGLLRLGILGEFFPTTVVHGMLAAIGVIIISKQIHRVFGVMESPGEPLEALAHIPSSVFHMNPEIALIGCLSLAILFGLPLVKHKYVRRIPAQMVVILVAIPLGMWFHLDETHTYSFVGQTFELSPKYLVDVPANLLKAMAHPDFSAFEHFAAYKWTVLFALIGTLESLLSAKAIDMLDPWKRKTDLDRDMLAIGAANTLSAAIGGLPMISEIVRSKANIDNGARTRFANFWHGLFLLAFVALLPGLIHKIPHAALAAMLVYTGFRLASPREFVHVYHIGREQLLIFSATLVGVLATDLLVGVLIGIGVKVGVHLANGVSLRSLFKTYLEVEEPDPQTCIIHARESAVFSNWIPFKRQIEDIGLIQRKNVVVDLAGTRLVDHSVMEKLHEMQQEFEVEGLSLQITGLEGHRPLAAHERATRKRALSRIRRLTLIADADHETILETQLAMHHVRGYASTIGRVVGENGELPARPLCRIEILLPPDECDELVDALRPIALPNGQVTICVETVYVVGLAAVPARPVLTTQLHEAG